ncbi:DNA gyrase inhibitor YacG [Candidatus Calescamantes bacterium]|nr:DNA gyrase inhibitor YacG [Candidatus Calescamantes bacterium]
MPGTKVQERADGEIFKIIKCPHCKKRIIWRKEEPLPPHFPFCSSRCKLVDLGFWLEEEYRIKEYFSRRGKDD